MMLEELSKLFGLEDTTIRKIEPILYWREYLGFRLTGWSGGGLGTAMWQQSQGPLLLAGMKVVISKIMAVPETGDYTLEFYFMDVVTND